MVSGRIYVTNDKIVCGAYSGSGAVLYPQNSYTHPAEKQCNYSYTHPSEIQCNAATEIDNLKTSVSEGKSLIASAITDKGVSTSSTATFQTMADNIGQLEIGANWIQSIVLNKIDSGYTLDVEPNSGNTISPNRLYHTTNKTWYTFDAGRSRNPYYDAGISYSSQFGIFSGYLNLNPGQGKIYVDNISAEYVYSSSGASTAINPTYLSAVFDVDSWSKIVTMDVNIPSSVPFAFDESGTKSGRFVITESFPNYMGTTNGYRFSQFSVSRPG